MDMSEERTVVVAVDGGGTKTDVAIARTDGTVLSRHRGPGCSQHEIGTDAAVAVIDDAVMTALGRADVDSAAVRHAGCYLTAIDLPDEQELMTHLLSRTPWGTRSVTVDNDLFAMLRAGTEEPDAAVVVCGTGINGLAQRGDGTTARIVALGRCSGDWGGGGGLVEEALWLAARAEDGRGERTGLRDAVLRWTGATSIKDVAVAVHRNQTSTWEWRNRVPEIFELADSGDRVAIGLVEAQGTEIGVLASALIARLDLTYSRIPLVLGGGVATSGSAILMGAIEAVLSSRAPHAEVTVLTEEPIEGAIRLSLRAR